MSQRVAHVVGSCGAPIHAAIPIWSKRPIQDSTILPACHHVICAFLGERKRFMSSVYLSVITFASVNLHRLGIISP